MGVEEGKAIKIQIRGFGGVKFETMGTYTGTIEKETITQIYNPLKSPKKLAGTSSPSRLGKPMLYQLSYARAVVQVA